MLDQPQKNPRENREGFDQQIFGLALSQESFFRRDSLYFFCHSGTIQRKIDASSCLSSMYPRTWDQRMIKTSKPLICKKQIRGLNFQALRASAPRRILPPSRWLRHQFPHQILCIDENSPMPQKNSLFLLRIVRRATHNCKRSSASSTA